MRTNGLKNDSDNDISTKLMQLENVKTKIQRHAGLRDANRPENLPNAIEKSGKNMEIMENLKSRKLRHADLCDAESPKRH